VDASTLTFSNTVFNCSSRLCNGLVQALYDGDGDNIKAWWLKCPRNQITTLDTHDGLGVVDVADLMTLEQTERTKTNIFGNGANANMRAIGGDVQNLDIYQVRLLQAPSKY
jgi:sucrose phosphorylase